VLRFGDAELDLQRRVITRSGGELKLTRSEYDLLTYFVQNPDRPLTRDMILSRNFLPT
jgi:DNA-binding response OmpR family regulator